ncbi:SMC-Scp complex subunit ScpB [Rhizobium sp. MHM7A]|uniref:SMC-Scp complex subunit ScpB n=1 Tax=Rhizobium sp. MHM7A TaxID=2583233 RepID=UPI001106A38F|nr:SMC-Scp complex subunit ScpB [Rhizobium sp. MHM7A]TLX15838.1 SMC-Scp complex subunit ScpB [Rhizobium sp. MHM7A]
MSALAGQIEALLIASSKPVSVEALAELLPDADIAAALGELSRYWQGRGMSLVEESVGVSLLPSKTAAKALSQVGGGNGRRLTEAAVETLCFIALNQPVTVKEIEIARGVKLFKGVVDALMDAGFVRASMRKTDSGRAVTYVTTDLLLEHFGLSSVADFPTPDELEDMMLQQPEI